MKKNNKTELAHLNNVVDSRTRMIAACYQLVGRGRRQRCRKSGHSIDPEDRFTITEPLTVLNGEGRIQLVRINLTDPKTNKPALIWVGHIRGHGQ